MSNLRLSLTADLRWMCSGCTRFEQQCKFRMKQVPPEKKDFKAEPKFNLHGSFKELELCVEKGCVTCRIFRKALLQGCYSQKIVTELRRSEGPVLVSFPDRQLEGFYVETLLSDSIELRERVAFMRSYGFNRRSSKTKAPDAFAAAKQWLAECADKHFKCTQLMDLETSSDNPTRLLDLGVNESPSILLINSPSHLVPYCALSYCWGPRKSEQEKARDMRTLKGNIATHMKGIQLQTFPPTLKDAITVSRELGIRYLWIDALCIIQDDNQDWAQESAKMHKVYGHAILTLSICSSSDVKEGFLEHRPIEAPIGKLAGERLEVPSKDLQDIRLLSPLMERGWTLQEEMLSPRIVYWSRHGIFWACSKGICAEPRPAEGTSFPTRGLSPPQGFLLSVLDADKYSPPTTFDLGHIWTDVIERYVRRDFTDLEDRLPALSGIAAIYKNRNGDEYLAGLWQLSLPGSLLWTVIGRPVSREAPKMYIAPSWSWASLPPGQAIKASSKRVARDGFLGKSVKTKGLDTLGRIESASITLRGRLRPLILPHCQSIQIPWPQAEKEEGEDIYPDLPVDLVYAINEEDGRVMVAQGTRHVAIIQLDVLPVPGLSSLRTSQCVKIDEESFILLQKVDGGEGMKKRLGCCTTHSYASFFVDAEEGDVVIV